MFGDHQQLYPNPDAIVYPKNMPYRGPVPGGLYEGKLIEIKGACPYGAQRFEVNLLTGLDPSSDRALHLSVRFDGRIVVRNTMQMGAWGIEERQGIFPFTSGRDFTIMILVDLSGYRIAVNGQHCWEFNHRIPFQRVSSVYIDGSVEIQRIEFIDKTNPYQPGARYPTVPVVNPAGYVSSGYVTSGYVTPAYQVTSGICPIPAIPSQPGICPIPSQPSYPSQPGICPIPSQPSYPSQPGTCPIPSQPGTYPLPSTRAVVTGTSYLPGTFPGTTVVPPPEQICPQPGYIPTGGSNLAPVYNPSIPYAYPIYGGLKPGMMVYISGRPTASAHRFTINFQSGTAPYPPPDIAFHFDVRFFSRSIVRNSRSNNVWNREETIASHFPFQLAVNFDMIIRVESERFMVALNGQHFLEFRHRLHPMSRFDTLYIENDIIVSSIRFA